MAEFDPKAFAADSGFDPKAFAEGLDEGLSVINEMHPQFDFADRLIVKNFGGDVDQSVGYLKKRHPELNIKVDGNGEIIAKAKGETDYRRLDPSGFFNSITNPAELGQDITDVLFSDVPQAIGTTAATAAGGLAGSLAGPAGTLAGGAAAGAASSAGLEALRQGIGKALGVRENFDGGDIALQAGFGAASPLLLGTGASSAQAAKLAIKELGEGASQEAVEAATKQILKNQRGALGYGYDAFRSKIAPKLGELTSGVAADTIRTARDNLDEIKGLSKSGITPLAQSAKGEAEFAVKSAKAKTGQAIEAAIDGSTTPVSLVSAQQPFDDLAEKITKALERRPENKALQAQLDAVLDTKATFFNEGETIASPRDAWELMQDLKSITKPGKTPNTTLASSFGPSATIADKRVVLAANKAIKNLNEGIATATAEHPTGGTGIVNKAYKKISQDAKEIKNFFASDDKIYQRLSNLESPSQRLSFERMQRFDAENGTDIVSKAKLLSAFQNFGDAQWLAKSSKGTTSTSGSVPLGLGAAALGGYVGAQQGGASGAWLGAGAGGLLGATLGGPKALRFYMQTQRNLSKMAEQGKRLGVGPQAGALSIWQMMQDKREK